MSQLEIIFHWVNLQFTNVYSIFYSQSIQISCTIQYMSNAFVCVRVHYSRNRPLSAVFLYNIHTYEYGHTYVRYRNVSKNMLWFSRIVLYIYGILFCEVPL